MNDNGKHETDLTPEERIAFLESLLERDDPGGEQGLIFVQNLDHEDPRVRATAIRGLWYSPDSSLMHRLIEIAEQDADAQVRAAAISGLGIYVYEGVVTDFDADWGPMNEIFKQDEISEADFGRVKDFLIGVYADVKRSLNERRFAIESLGFLSDQQVADLIEQAYNQPQREMRISALFAMGRSGSGRWTEVLARELYNADHDIQFEAIRAVGEIGITELGEDLWRLTYAENRDVMLEAIDALGQSGWEGAFERLEELTLHADLEIAQVAEEALDEWLWMSEILSQDGDLDLDLDEES